VGRKRHGAGIDDCDEGQLAVVASLCAYPQVAKYSGSGDPNAAASFSCSAP